MRRAVRSALEHLYERDRHLIDVDANERSLTHRLAVYLETEFPDWDVDCEYNRAGGDPKRIDELEDRLRAFGRDEEPTRDTKGRTVFPDIIVHRRGTRNNLVVIEAKKSSSDVPDDLDRLKVHALRYQDEYHYHYGVLIRFEVGPEAQIPAFDLI